MTSSDHSQERRALFGVAVNVHGCMLDQLAKPGGRKSISAFRSAHPSAAIEPIIGNLKSGYRMNRNHYQGETGDAVNATLSAAGFNLSKLLAFFLRLLMGRVLVLRLAGCRSIVTNFAFNMP